MTAQSYASLDQFKDAIDLTDQDSDAALSRALDAATEWIDGYTGRVFGSVTASQIRYFDASTPTSLSVPDLVTVTEVAVDTRQDLSFATILAASAYQTYPLNVGQPGVRGGYTEIRIRPTVGQGFWPGYQVRVTGTWGYGSVPASVESACILVANRYFRRSAAPFGIISAPESGEFARLPSKDPDVQALLADFCAGTRGWVAV
jgi:hypothetical protein